MAKKRTLAFLILVLLLAIVGMTYYLYVSERESYFADRNFRLLALWSNRMSKTVDDYKYHFQYRISTSLEPLENENKFKDKFEKEFEKFKKHREGLLTLVSISQKTKKVESNNLVTDPRITAQLSPKGKDFLRLTYYEERTIPQVCEDSVCAVTIEADLSIFKVISPLITKKVFSDVIVFDSETGKVHFQKDTALYKIDDFRDIVFQRSGTEGFFSFFSNNSDVQNDNFGSSTPPLKELLQNPTHRRITIGDISYELFTQPVILPQLTPKKQAHYRQTKDAPARLILAGLVKTEKFQSEYRAIPHTWLLVFFFFVLLGLLSLPIIHLGCMDSREPLRSIHVLSLLIACVFGTALITLLFLDVAWLNNVRHSLDKQLEKAAKNIKVAFEDELEKTVRQLVAYDRSSPFRDDFNCVTQTEFFDNSVCATDDTRESGEERSKRRWVARKEYPYPCDEKHKEKFPYHCPYDLVFWVDSNKYFRITWTTDSEYHLQTSNVSLAHRDYVKRTLDPDPKSSLWHTILYEDQLLTFYAQPLHSLQTGKHRVIFSIASSHSEEDPEGKSKKWVAAIRTELQSLESAAIPDGTGFAVIEDEGGRVLFHSDDNRSLWENFFEETDNNARLKAHIFSQTAGEFQGTYWGEGHSFYSIPLPDVPWSLVVFRNKELFRTTNFEALLLASALFALYTVISIIVPAVIWLFNKARRQKKSMSWFWPDSSRHYGYYAVIVLIFFLVGIPLFSCDIFPDDCAVWFVFPYLLFSLTGLWFLIKVCPKPTPPISPKQLHFHYACTIISFLLLFSVLPMVVFFKTAADREMTLALKYNLITLGQKFLRTSDIDYSQIQREINDEQKFATQCPEKFSSESECELVKGEQVNSQQEGGPLQCPEKFVSLKNHILLQHSIHLNVIEKTGLCVSENGLSANFRGLREFSLIERMHRRIRENSLSRLSNPISIRTLGLIWDQSTDPLFHWVDSPSSLIALAFQVPLNQSGSEKQANPQMRWGLLQLSSPSDIRLFISGFPAKGHFWGSIVLIAFVPMFVMVPIFIVSRIFPILLKSSTNENSNQAKRNLLIIGLPELLKSYRQENLPSDKWEPVDCHLISDSLEWWKVKRQVLSTQKVGVTLEHFEYQFGMSQFDRTKLELLAALLVKDKQICVLSTLNPLKLDHEDALGAPSSDESKSPVPVSLQAWSQIFQSFTLHYASLDSRSVPVGAPYFAAIWQARTTDEKITLYHLARDGFVHAENPDLQPLFALGLIKSKPAPRLFSDDFEDYVLNAAQREQLDTKKPVKSYAWKWPLAIVLIVLGMGLLLTQKELHNVVVLMLSLLPVLLPTLSELIEDQQADGKAT